MYRREFVAGLGWLQEIAQAAGGERVECDVFVYGSTPGGVAAAVEAARRGARVVLACPKKHPGGMAASGLSTTDAVRTNLFGGLMAEFISRVRERYVRELGADSDEFKLIHDGWYYEPSVAEAVFREMIEGEDGRIRWLAGRHLRTVTVRDRRVVMADVDGVEVTARTFIDGTYEGDLCGAARAPYRVGREGKAEYGEPFAGIHYMNWRTGQQIITPDTGEPSMAIQAFCARSIFTNDPAKRVPIEKPVSYEEHLPDLLPLIGDFESGRVKSWGPGTPLPRRKYQMNGNIEAMTSLNCPGMNWAWPEADRHHRARLEQFHVDHAASLLWFLQNDKRVPDAIRNRLAPMGLHKDEFKTTGHWPWQMYVRQGRRIEGRALVTQHNFLVDKRTGRTPAVKQAIAIGEHSFDVHPCHDRRFAVEGYMEGVLWYPKKAFGPAQPGQVPYGALLPKKIDNLIAPVPLACTHVAMSVLRMEPVWMTLGQVAGLAAVEAMRQRVDVAEIDPEPLPKLLKVKVDPYA